MWIERVGTGKEEKQGKKGMKRVRKENEVGTENEWGYRMSGKRETEKEWEQRMSGDRKEGTGIEWQQYLLGLMFRSLQVCMVLFY